MTTTALNAAWASLPRVHAAVHYLKAMSTKPTLYTYDPPDGTARNNADYDAHWLPIHNARPLTPNLSLDVEGFLLAQRASAVRDFGDDEEVRAVYYPETAALLRDLTGATRIHVFDHLLRKRAADRPALGLGRVSGSAEPPGPVGRAHADYTPKSAPQRVHDFFPEEAGQLLTRRFAQLNVWRPIVAPLQDAPLALLDARTVEAGDLIANDLVYPHRVGETYLLAYNRKHRWFYFPDLALDEALVFKNFDSDEGRARVAPHGAFEDPNTPANAPLRESIELRALLFFDA